MSSCNALGSKVSVLSRQYPGLTARHGLHSDDGGRTTVVIRVLARPPLVRRAPAGFFTLQCTAIALRAYILRRWHEALSTMVPLPFLAKFHAAYVTSLRPGAKAKKTQEEEFILKSEEESAKNRHFQTAAITPLLKRRLHTVYTLFLN
jgi:hypothetical protein